MFINELFTLGEYHKTMYICMCYINYMEVQNCPIYIHLHNLSRGFIEYLCWFIVWATRLKEISSAKVNCPISLGLSNMNRFSLGQHGDICSFMDLLCGGNSGSRNVLLIIIIVFSQVLCKNVIIKPKSLMSGKLWFNPGRYVTWCDNLMRMAGKSLSDLHVIAGREMPQIHGNWALGDKFLQFCMMLHMGIRYSKTTANKVG